MRISRNKIVATMIALFLVLTIAIPLFALPNANAWSTNKTYPFIDAIPNPVGVNQTILINFGLLNYLTAENDGWNITIAITKPDNTTDTLGPYKTWSTGAAGKSYVPDQVGTYYLQTIFLGEWYNYTFFGRRSETFYEASKSDKLALVVQKDPVPYYPGQPLPSEYWTRSIDSQLREWYSIAGSWVAVPRNLYAPFNEGPESAHILWARPIGDTMGGLAGGDTEEHGYGTGDAYEGKWLNSLIIGGVLYYNKFESGQPQQQVVAVDLHTGKELWTKTFLNNQRVAFGQVLYWNSRNYRGAFSYLWVSTGGGFGPTALPTTWSAFEPLTGEWRYNMTNVPGGFFATSYRGPNDEILMYALTNIGNATKPNYRLTQWNSSYVVTMGKTGMSESWGSQVLGQVYNATTRGYDLNVSVPALATAGNTLPGSIQTVFPGDRVIGSRITSTQVNLWALSLSEGSEGALLFNETWAAPAEWVQGNLSISGFQGGWMTFSPESMVGIIYTKENRAHYGFSLETGKYLWQTKSTFFADAWTDSASSEKIIAYDKLYTAGVGGTVYAFDIKTGALLWTYNATDPYHESYIGNNWWLIPVLVTDGKLYVGHMEHSALDPKPRGAPFICLNATTGDLIWRIDGAFRQTRWGGRAIIGDSVIATMDTYDQRVYAIGKGPSAITVSAPDIAAPFGTPVMIKGTVTDVSPGTKDDALTLRFPNGVPAVSDESMSEWMLYVYKQFARPTNATGVKVSIYAIDPNNNTIHVDDTTSDSSGMFSYTFTPENPGKYTVFATFAGSKSYYPSFAETAFAVTAAPPTPTPTPQPEAAPDYTTHFIGTGIAIIIAVAVATVLLLRKRP